MKEDGLVFNGHKFLLKKRFMKFIDYMCPVEKCKSEIRIFTGLNNAIIKCDHNHCNENVDPEPNIVKFIHECQEENPNAEMAEILTDAKNEVWMFIDGFRYKMISKTEQTTE